MLSRSSRVVHSHTHVSHAQGTLLSRDLTVMQASGRHSMAPSWQGRAGEVGSCAEDAVQNFSGVAPEAVGQRGPLVVVAL